MQLTFEGIMKTLSGKVAIVTGAGQGVGLGIAQALGDAGAAVVISGRDEGKLKAAGEVLRARGVEVLTVPADVRKRASAEATVAATIQRFGRLDVLVNNAQSSRPGLLLEQTDDETIALTLESGLMGTLYHMQAALPQMKHQGGSIINLGSREGIIGGAGFGLYAATKEAIRGLSRTAAREWGQYGIRVNVLCPAALSPAAVQYFKEHPGSEEHYKKVIALGRMGDPREDIGPIAVFLAGPESRYVTGQTLNVDGGQTML
jgi:NAD(P)-dependent dehydrogenase (short-subunit alcohol dehydrogenase family)